MPRGDPTKTVGPRFTADQHAALDELARERGVTLAVLVRDAALVLISAPQGEVRAEPPASEVEGPPARRVAPSKPTPKAWRGCSDHPDAGAELSKGKWWCKEAGCARPAREVY